MVYWYLNNGLALRDNGSPCSPEESIWTPLSNGLDRAIVAVSAADSATIYSHMITNIWLHESTLKLNISVALLSTLVSLLLPSAPCKWGWIYSVAMLTAINSGSWVSRMCCVFLRFSVSQILKSSPVLQSAASLDLSCSGNSAAASCWELLSLLLTSFFSLPCNNITFSPSLHPLSPSSHSQTFMFWLYSLF